MRYASRYRPLKLDFMRFQFKSSPSDPCMQRWKLGAHHFAKSHECDVSALLHHLGLADREREVHIQRSIRHRKCLPIQQLIFKDAHWIRVSNCCLQTQCRFGLWECMYSGVLVVYIHVDVYCAHKAELLSARSWHVSCPIVHPIRSAKTVAWIA